MDKSGDPFAIDDHLRGHPPELEEIDLLSVKFEDAGSWVGQTDKRQIIFAPVGSESSVIFRTDHDNFGLAVHKFLKVMAQLRHMPLAEWSGKAAVEDDQDVVCSAEIGELNGFTPEIIEGEIGSGQV